jgi:putative peptidoglycan lipid II flippase
MATNVILNLLLVLPLAHAGLALATSLAAFVNAGLLFRGLHKEKVYRPRPGWSALAWRVAIASLALAALLWWGAGDLGQWFAWSGYERAGQLLLWVVAGAIAYFAVLAAAGLRPAHLQSSVTGGGDRA